LALLSIPSPVDAVIYTLPPDIDSKPLSLDFLLLKLLVVLSPSLENEMGIVPSIIEMLELSTPSFALLITVFSR